MVMFLWIVLFLPQHPYHSLAQGPAMREVFAPGCPMDVKRCALVAVAVPRHKVAPVFVPVMEPAPLADFDVG